MSTHLKYVVVSTHAFTPKYILHGFRLTSCSCQSRQLLLRCMWRCAPQVRLWTAEDSAVSFGCSSYATNPFFLSLFFSCQVKCSISIKSHKLIVLFKAPISLLIFFVYLSCQLLNEGWNFYLYLYYFLIVSAFYSMYCRVLLVNKNIVLSSGWINMILFWHVLW